jgi:hypothetical protein
MSSTDDQLVRWAVKQRVLYRAGKLAQNKIERLESMTEWDWGYSMSEQWQKRYLELRNFISSNERLPQPKDNGSLSMWCQNQRSNYLHGRLPDDKIAQLESEQCWQWELIDSAWNVMYSKMSEYIEQHGTIPSSKKTHKCLWNWMNTQKSNLKKGILTEQHKLLLNNLPQWVWGRDDEWMVIYNRLKGWFEQHDDPPTKHQDKQLAFWIRMQRMQKRKGKMSPQRELLLKSLDGWQWEANAYKRRSDLDTRNDKWDQIFAAIEKFVATNDRLPSVLDKSPESKRIGRWLVNQKSAVANGTITVERKIKLDAIANCRTKVGGIPKNIRRQNAIEAAKGIFSRAKGLGRLPSYCWTDPQYKKDAAYICRWKQAKHKSGQGRTAWYPEVEAIAMQFGFPQAFN